MQQRKREFAVTAADALLQVTGIFCTAAASTYQGRNNDYSNN